MNGFGGIGGWEVVLVTVIAILVLGPERMIEYAFRAGRFVRKMSIYWQEGAAAFREEVKNIEETVESDVRDIQNIGGLRDATSEFKAYEGSIKSQTTPTSTSLIDTVDIQSIDEFSHISADTKIQKDFAKEKHVDSEKKSSRESSSYSAWSSGKTVDR
jgi:Sec-independent protein translocase protein TatA